MIRNSEFGDNSRGFFAGVDPWSVAIYVMIVLVGCFAITAASFDSTSSDYFAFSHFYIKQLVWVSVAFIAAIFVLLLDHSLFHKYSYLLYVFGVGVLVMALLFGREVNGAKAWFEVGSFRIQPVEMAKITTSIAMARVMSEYSFNIGRFSGLAKVATVVLIPLAVIVLQNDTGSGIVFGSFLFVLYREGLSGWLCVTPFLIAGLFIISFLLSPFALLVLLFVAAVAANAILNKEIKLHTIYVALIALTTLIVVIIKGLNGAEIAHPETILMWVIGASLVPLAIYSLIHRERILSVVIGLFVGSTLFVRVCDFIFNSILREHQQNRIMTFLGIVSDPLGTGYNVNQSKIAIGSGGFWGKGFLNGTQIKYGFVPERHTDFIFCGIAEEWGFIGSMVLLGLLMALIFKLIRMGERLETFGRVYCYCVASILIFHIFVNIGMTIGLMPVMGIPLPFVSYGGSSLVAFTVMLFIAIKLDAANTLNSR